MRERKTIPITRSSMPSLEEYINEISDIWDSHCLTNMGVKHTTFERMLKEKLGVDNITLYTNGHSALECAIEALHLKGKVITTPFTFASTTHAIVRKGLTPVFVDIRPDDYTLDPTKIEEAIDDDTCAILPVHVYGNVCDVEAIQQIANRYDLKVVYDAAHAFGIKKDGISIGCFGDISMFSFHATKVFNSIEGGALCFKDASLYDYLNQMKNFGIISPEKVAYIGGNSKMNEFSAAMGICNLRHVDEDIAKRRILVERYSNNLEKISGLKLCEAHDGIESNYSYMPVVFNDDFPLSRDEVFDELRNKGIMSRKYFYPLVTDFDCYNHLYDSSETPIAKYIATHVLTLPLYAELSLDDVDEICELLGELSRRG